MKWYQIKHRLQWKLRYINLCLWFIQMGWMALRGKIIIIDDRTVESRGGFKYYQVNISKRPVSKNHDYSNW